MISSHIYVGDASISHDERPLHSMRKTGAIWRAAHGSEDCQIDSVNVRLLAELVAILFAHVLLNLVTSNKSGLGCPAESHECLGKTILAKSPNPASIRGAALAESRQYRGDAPGMSKFIEKLVMLQHLPSRLLPIPTLQKSRTQTPSRNRQPKTRLRDFHDFRMAVDHPPPHLLAWRDHIREASLS